MKHRGGAWLSNGWLVTAVSLAGIAILTVLLWSPWQRPALAGHGPLRIYCAAGLVKPVQELLRQYENFYGVRVEANFDGSGKLLSTMRIAGGQGDLYLASEESDIDTARKQGLIAEVIPVARLRPALVVNKETQEAMAKEGRPIVGLKDLTRSNLKVVLANQQASIGKLSRQILEKAGLWSKIQAGMQDRSARVSMVTTVNEVAQVVRTRQGFAGIVWSATADQYDGLLTIPVAEMAELKSSVQVAVLAKSREPTAALRLARFLSAADRGGKVFASHHFEPIPDADLWEEAPALHLSAGAMLLPGIDATVKAFAKREGVTIRTTYAGCGILIGQMKAIKKGQNDRHFPDAYFACDQSFLTDVQPWFEAGTLVSRNQIILIVPHGNPKKVRSLADLARPELRVGLAHPKNSALGQLTDKLLRKLGLYDQVYRPDRATPVAHTDAAHLLVNEMRTGALDVAVVYRSNALSAPQNKEYIDIVELDLAEAIASQPYAVAKDSAHKYLMRRLLQALVSPDNAEHFRALGFQWMVESP